MITLADIEKMSREEKLQAMETLWEELSKNSSEVASPAWHKDVLQKTRERLDSGAESVVDWETAKRELRQPDE